MKFTVFDKNNGQILRSGYCQPCDFERQVIKTSEDVIEGQYLDTHFYIKNGKPIPFPLSPGEFYFFDYSSKTWIKDTTAQANAVISTRNSLLTASDWTQLPDVPIATKNKWAIYRQALRDVPQQPGFPENVVWPTQP